MVCVCQLQQPGSVSPGGWCTALYARARVANEIAIFIGMLSMRVCVLHVCSPGHVRLWCCVPQHALQLVCILPVCSPEQQLLLCVNKSRYRYLSGATHP